MNIIARITSKGLDINPQMLQRFCFLHAGQIAEIAPREKPRSLNQLRMYRAWLDKLAADTGNESADDLHEFLLHKLAPRTVIVVHGKDRELHEQEVVKRTSKMDKLEMSEFMEKAAAYTGFPLPTKEELEQMGYISNS